MSAILTVQPLTREAFAPYGDVIEATAGSAASVYAVNDGRAKRYHDLAKVDTSDGGGRIAVSIFHTQAVSLPYEFTELERHPLGSQAFVPMHSSPFLVVVALASVDGSPGALSAFLSNGAQGVNFRRGVWHHSLLALREGDFLVIDREEKDGDNCDVTRLAGVHTVARP